MPVTRRVHPSSPPLRICRIYKVFFLNYTTENDIHYFFGHGRKQSNKLNDSVQVVKLHVPFRALH